MRGDTQRFVLVVLIVIVLVGIGSLLVPDRPRRRASVRRCRVCGCTDARACVDDIGRPCSWVFHDLCSACAETLCITELEQPDPMELLSLGRDPEDY